MKVMRGRIAIVAAAAALAAVAACEEDLTRVTPGQPAPIELERGVHVMLTQPLPIGERPVPRSGQARDVIRPTTGEILTLEMHLVRVEVEDEISSYQAELRYDTGALGFRDGIVPDGIIGAFNEPEPGRVRMVGVSLDGIPDRAAFVMNFNVLHNTGETLVTLIMEELTADVGAHDLTALTSARELVVRWDAGADESGIRSDGGVK